ncbi:hypothetical protein, partial [Ekhidna sp.]
NSIRLFPSLIVFIVLTACSDDEPSLSESFFKIYDDSNFDVGYDPIDVIEVNNGYIILSATDQPNSNFDGIQLIKLDDEGNFVDEAESAFNDYEAPIGDMYFDDSDSTAYFFAKNSSSLDAVLISINTSLEVVDARLLGGVNYPLAVSESNNDNALVVLSYDPVNLQTELTEVSNINSDPIIGNIAEYSIGAGNDTNVENLVINHFTSNNDFKIPFFCGQTPQGNYYFNGFTEFSMSLVISSPNNILAEDRRVLGQPINDPLIPNPLNAGIRSVMPLEDGNYAVAGFQFEENYQLHSNPLTIGSVAQLDFGNMAEIRPYSKSKIISYTTNDVDYTIFASETKGNQVVLHFYNASSGSIDGIHYVGFLNPFTFSSIKVGSDNSLLILGTTFTAGRFERIFLTKISEGEVSSYLN